MEERDFDAIVIGGGPAGMMAAAKAAERGSATLLLEKNDILGRKLLISGKGRCNITNAADINEYFENFGKTGQFLRDAFSKIFNTELMDFFGRKGVPLKIERGKRVFPKSDRSKDILNALRGYLYEVGVKVLLKSEVKDIIIWDRGKKRVVLSNGIGYIANSVAICTGGLSYPQTGSTGFGFEITRKLGHNVIPPEPALVPLVTETKLPKSWQGISLKNIEIAIVCNDRKKTKKFGDALFTHFGFSGPVILDLSNDVFNLLKSKKDVYMSINLKPAIDKSTLNDRLLREFTKHSNKILRNTLKELLPLRMAKGFIKLCKLDPEGKVNQITKSQRKQLIDKLTDLRFKIKCVRPIEEAIITKGGVDTRQINPKTMESKFIKGLFFAGEVLDIDAKTGGYNMQAAFSTGYLCGENL
jgi:predicted Rossmann fold flavoprotein